MSYVVLTIDRRAEYYARSAPLIAADPLGFYTRAEKGRRFLATRLSIHAMEPVNVVLFNDARRKTFLPMPEPAAAKPAVTEPAPRREATGTG